jgi:LuxR family maltose regulon positive regulatory protein
MWEGAALAGLGQAQYLRGETAQARETLRRAVGLIPDAHPNLLVFAISNFALAEYADGDVAHADPILDRAVEMMAIQPHSVVAAILHTALGERARAGGDPRGAVGWFGSAIAILGEGKRSAWLANTYLLNASAFRALGDANGEIRCLDAADAILDTLSDPGDLARRSKSLRERARMVTRRRTRFGEVLSDREIAVLQLAGAGLTQREIADQLFISFNTVKSHLRSAYSKLGVNTRDDALASLSNLRSDPAPRRREESTAATPTQAT